MQMTIKGRLTGAADSFPVVNPATGKVLAHAPDCSAQQLEEAVAAATEAFGQWRRRPIEQRREVLRQCAAKVRAHQPELARM